MQNKNILVGVGVLAGIVVLVLVVMSKFNSPVQKNVILPTASPEAMNEKSKEASPGMENKGAVKEIVVSGNEYSFTPKAISLKTGEQIKLTFKNAGNLPHNLLIDELGVATKTITGGKEDVVTFTANKNGSFKFYCSVGSHRKLGMEGEVKVN